MERNTTTAIVSVARIICARSYHFVIAVWRAKEAESARVKYWEVIGDNLKKRGWSLGYVSTLDSEGRTIWIADAHRDDGKRFVVRPDELLTAFLELESAIRLCGELSCQAGGIFSKLDRRYTDSNQAEDFFPARFFASSEPLNPRNSTQREKRKEEL
jgi:hypothetical protein